MIETVLRGCNGEAITVVPLRILFPRVIPLRGAIARPPAAPILSKFPFGELSAYEFRLGDRLQLLLFFQSPQPFRFSPCSPPNFHNYLWLFPRSFHFSTSPPRFSFPNPLCSPFSFRMNPSMPLSKDFMFPLFPYLSTSPFCKSPP